MPRRMLMMIVTYGSAVLVFAAVVASSFRCTLPCTLAETLHNPMAGQRYCNCLVVTLAGKPTRSEQRLLVAFAARYQENVQHQKNLLVGTSIGR
jgi:hypothetical protein